MPTMVGKACEATIGAHAIIRRQVAKVQALVDGTTGKRQGNGIKQG